LPFRDPDLRRAKQREYDARYRAKQRLARGERPRRSVWQVSSAGQKSRWLREQPGWDVAFLGSALLSTLAIKARQAGLYHKAQGRTRIEVSLNWHIERMKEGDHIND